MIMNGLHWAAGFLEGEGTFYGPHNGHQRISIIATQVQREPLDRMKKLLGGNVLGPYVSKQLTHQPHFRWGLHGTNAAALMMTLYALMSPKRKDTIKAALVAWRVAPGNPKTWRSRGICQNGHPMTGENYIIAPSGHGRCRRCGIEGRRRYYEKNKEKWCGYARLSRARKLKQTLEN